MDFEDSTYEIENATSPRRSEGSNLPEMVAFYQEENLEFLKEICMDREVPFRYKCLVENCQLDHNIIYCMLNSDLESTSESPEETPETVPSTPNESQLSREHNCKKDVLKQDHNFNKMIMEAEEDFHTVDCNLIDRSLRKIIPEIHHLKELPIKEAMLANSVDDDPSIKTQVIHHSDPSTTPINSREETAQTADSQQSPRPDDQGLPGSLTSSNRSFSYQHGFEDKDYSLLVGHFPGSLIAHSGSIPYSGNVSLRSTSSNASAHSFAFPVLPSEWNGSPVRMVKADQKRISKNRPQYWRRICCLCCKF